MTETANKTSPFDNLVGGPGRAYVDQQTLVDLIELDRTVFGDRFQNITSHLRSDATDPSTIGNYNLVAYPIDTRWHQMYKGIVYEVPDALPGSDWVTGSSSGTDISTRGGLACMFRGSNIDAFFGIRSITISGTYGQSTTFGSWSFASGTISGGFDWSGVTDISTGYQGFLLFPVGTSPGDSMELSMWVRRANPASPGYASGWMQGETFLSQSAP